MATIRFRGTRADVTRIALQLAAVLAGRAPDTQGVAKGFMLSLGFSALTDIKDAYIVKAGGGTDQMGIRWPKLAAATIAARKRRDVKATPAIIKRRAELRAEITQLALRRFRLSLSESEAQRRAKALGAQIILSTKNIDILRDTGVLLDSLSPGRLAGGTYNKPSGEGGAEQIFEIGAGQVIVGTNVKYASTHQRGDARRNIPARPFLPDESHPVPQIWWDRWLKLSNKALVVGAELLYRRSA